jgi:hypothetical protein
MIAHLFANVFATAGRACRFVATKQQLSTSGGCHEASARSNVAPPSGYFNLKYHLKNGSPFRQVVLAHTSPWRSAPALLLKDLSAGCGQIAGLP